MRIIGDKLLNDITTQAKDSPRLRMNYNFHQSLDDKCHRFLNAVEPGTKVEIHRHPTKDESFVLLRGRVRVNTYNDDGSVMESVVLCPEEGDSMGWIYQRMFGIMWNPWSLGVSSLNVRKGRSYRTKMKGYFQLMDKRSCYDTKIFIRPFGLIYRIIVSMASIADSGDTCKSEDAGRPCVLCAEESGS